MTECTCGWQDTPTQAALNLVWAQWQDLEEHIEIDDGMLQVEALTARGAVSCPLSSDPSFLLTDGVGDCRIP